MPPVSRGTTGPAIDRSKENAENWTREVKLLMRQGKHSSDVCLPLPNVPATSGQHFAMAPCKSPIVFSVYCITLRFCPKVHPCNIMVSTQNSFPYAMYVIPFNVVGIPQASLTRGTASSVGCRKVAAKTECEMGCWNRNRNETAF